MFMHLFKHSTNFFESTCILDTGQDFEDTVESKATTREAVFFVFLFSAFLIVCILYNFTGFFGGGGWGWDLEDKRYLKYKGEKY